MTKPKFFYHPVHPMRRALTEVMDIADQIHELQNVLVIKLSTIDQNRYYIKYGDRSMMGFCRSYLRFTKTEAQSIVTRVRRFVPTTHSGVGIETPPPDTRVPNFNSLEEDMHQPRSSSPSPRLNIGYASSVPRTADEKNL